MWKLPRTGGIAFGGAHHDARRGAGPVRGDRYRAKPLPRLVARSVSRRPKRLRLVTLAKSALGSVGGDTPAALENACRVFADLGHRIEPVDIDPAERLAESFGAVVAANLAAVPFADDELIDPFVRVFVETGRNMGARDYVSAMATMHNTAREIVRDLSPPL